MSNFPADPPPGMDPQIKSVLTSALLAGASAIAAWAAGHGLIDAGQETALVNILVTVAGLGVAVAVGWWKKRNQSPTALITAVNAGKNGVMVVDENEPVPMVTEPLKGPK